MSDGSTRTIVKQEDFATLYSDGTILLKEVRVSYPHLEKPYVGEDGTAKYGIIGMMPQTEAYKASAQLVIREINQMVKERNKDAAIPSDRKFMRDGNLKVDKPEYAGHYTISAHETRQPSLRGRGKDPKTGKARALTSEEAGRVFYGGCWVNCLIRPWWQDHKKGGKRVNANLLAVQFVRDDEAFGEGRISEDAIDESFGAIDDDESGYDADALAEADEL
jgi:hypothetical protein